MIEKGILKDNIYSETASAANEIKNRPVFQKLLNQILKEGDTLMVTKIDRCSRNTLEFLKLQDTLLKRDIIFISLDLPFYEGLIATTFSAIAEFENNRRKDRQMEGIAAAKKAGKYKVIIVSIKRCLINNFGAFSGDFIKYTCNTFQNLILY